ncbi:MAG: hypothetical protein LBR58_06500 [Propionibacteriaceae bacterium]|nr:hypothetical protein [Propionibacteriaceae bacterium]
MLEEIERGDAEPIAVYEGDALREIVAALDARDAAETAIESAVAKARAQGATWGMIGAALRVTRQAAQKRYAYSA